MKLYLYLNQILIFRSNEAILLINGMDSSKFPKFLLRIVEKIDQKNAQIFSEEEENKLKTIFSIDETQKIKLIIQTICHLLNQMIYNLVKPKVLAKELSDLGLESDKVKTFVEIWNNNASKIIEKLKEKSYEIAAIQLSDINWRFKLLTNESCQSHQKEPLAQLDLSLKTQTNSNRNISIDFSHEELSQLYEKLETIQTQIDVLQK